MVLVNARQCSMLKFAHGAQDSVRARAALNYFAVPGSEVDFRLCGLCDAFHYHLHYVHEPSD